MHVHSRRATRELRTRFSWVLLPFGMDPVHLIMRLAGTCATEEFVTFVSGLAGEGTGAESTLRHGQHDPEEASLAFFAYQLDATAVDFDCPARGREAQPRPSRFSGSSLIDTVEALEDSPVMHRGDAQPCVLDLDRGLPGGRLLHPHANCPFGGGVFDRVVEHVDQTQPEDRGI